LTKDDSALLAGLEKSGSLGKPHLDSPSTVDSFSGRQRVAVSAALNPRGGDSANAADDAFLASSESAYADLLRRLDLAVETAKTGCKVMARQNYNGGYHDVYETHGLQARIRCSGTAFQITPVVAELERAKPYVFVRGLKIIVRTAGYGAARKDDPHDVVDVSFTLLGYVQQPAQRSSD
jgi:hypothetical protein